MAAKARISKEDILRNVCSIITAQGIGAVSSRSVAQAMGCSQQPIYSHFPTMEDLRRETYHYACRQCAAEVLESPENDDFITTLTRWMLNLAENRPNLFQFLYLTNTPESVMHLPEVILASDSHARMAEKIACTFGISVEDGKDLLVRTCLFLMGICATICINQMDLDEVQVLTLTGKTVFDMVEGCRRRSGTLETEHLLLRPWTEEDAHWLYEYASNPKVAQAAGWPCHRSPQDSLQIIRTHYRKPGTYAIIPRTLGHPAGSIRLLTGDAALLPDLPQDQGQIRFWLGEPFWGRGYVPEAVDALIYQGFRHQGLRAIWCICNADNLSSQAVFHKCGFQTVSGNNPQKCLVRILKK